MFFNVVLRIFININGGERERGLFVELMFPVTLLPGLERLETRWYFPAES